MPIPKNVPGAGGGQSRPTGLPSAPQTGLPRQTGTSARPIPDQRPKSSSPNESGLPDFELPSMDLSDVPTHTREQSFGDSKPTRVPNNGGPIRNPYDSEDDDTFTTLSVDEQLAEESREDKRTREREEALRRAREAQKQKDELAAKAAREAVAKELPEVDEVPDSRSMSAKTRKSAKGNKKDARGQDVFIDEENLKLEPFGGKRKVRVNDLDGRKNLRKRSQIIQYITIGLVVLIVGFSVKSAFFPQKSLTADEVATIVAETAGVSDFPIEAGKSFATDFMKAYLTVNGDELSKEALGYYYSGSLSAADSPNRSITPGFKQTVVYGPAVYESKALTPYSARYTVGALVKPEAVTSEAPADGSTAKWAYFNVNVYYDKVSKNFSITPDSPSLVPAVEVGDPSKIPTAQQLGTGPLDQSVSDSLKSVIQGFIKGYAVSSPTDHSNLDQYIVSNSDASLQKGLAKAYTLAGTENDAILYQAYSTADPNVIKVAVTVNWRDQLGSDKSVNKLEYKSSYVMTLQKQSNEKYLVSKFAPQYYVMSDKK
jgi:hypothetical protein